MQNDIIYSHKVSGLKVFDQEGKSYGRLHFVVFLPKEKTCAGFLVKRPDVAWMFRRKDLFIPLDACVSAEYEFIFNGQDYTVGSEALKKKKINIDACIIWDGMYAVTKSGKLIGQISSVVFSKNDGKIVKVMIGSTNRARDLLYGKIALPSSYVEGFRFVKPEAFKKLGIEKEDICEGVIVLKDEVADIIVEKGLIYQASSTASKVTAKIKAETEQMASTIQKQTKKIQKSVDSGAYAAGEKLSGLTGMFSEFKEEYKKASQGDEQSPKK